MGVDPKPKTTEPLRLETRMGLDYGAVQFIPLSLGRTRIRGLCKVDPKLDSLPPWLMNWIATKVNRTESILREPACFDV